MAKKLTDIVREDFHKVREVFHTVRRNSHNIKQASWRFAKGIPHGFYTPALVFTGNRRLNREIDRFAKGEISEPEGAMSSLGQVLGAIAVHAPLLHYAASNNGLKYYLGALAATNTADYAVSVYRRSKNEKAYGRVLH